MPDNTNSLSPEDSFKKAFVRFAERFVPDGNIQRSPRLLEEMSFLEGFGMSSLASLQNLRERGGMRYRQEGGKDIFTIPLEGPLQPELARFYVYSLNSIGNAAAIPVRASRISTKINDAEGAQRNLGRSVEIHIPSTHLEALTNELNCLADYLGHEENLTQDTARVMNLATALDKIEGVKVYPYLHIDKQQIRPGESVYAHRFDLQCEGIPQSLADNSALRNYITSSRFPSHDTRSRDLTRRYSGRDRHEWTIEDIGRTGVAEGVIAELQRGRPR